ncbi:MAG: ABC transporter substrate-binding protein [Sphingobium sp.]|nr:ABC transporter substrate-binding protein [Sphingobium sp.]MBP6111846.1 ABC transporter substrate-binding protein [Sphingobium sp.]MBP8669788.1 ABC transporter substrate-binding protein [Sphingobium sp.]MBP9156452.1 ABC transporter substrate-binding protein [Sphingobium sp.]
MAVAALTALVLLPGCSKPSATPTREQRDAPSHSVIPRRIVSMNPCVDAILREVADPAQIAAISHYSHDPRASSVPADWAQRYAAVGDTAEDVLSARPDLVIAGPHIAPDTLSALQRMGVPVLSTRVPATVAESAAQIAEIAARIGQLDKGRALTHRITHALAQARGAPSAYAGSGPYALIWQDSGLVPGPGTLVDDLLREAGFRSASAQMGLTQWNMVSTEQILLSPPDIVMTGAAGMATGTGGSNAMLANRVLHKARARIMTAVFPSRLLHCGGPTIIEASARLADIRAQWQRRQGA